MFNKVVIFENSIDIEISTEEIQAQGEELLVYKSHLTLINISLNSSTTFKCAAPFEEEVRHSNDLSFSIIGKI